jgi:hypothetical protein
MNDQQFTETLDCVIASRLKKFSALARLAGLNPVTDFIGADMRGADLRNDDLRTFDLTGADLRGANLKNCKLPSSALENACLLSISKIRFKDPTAVKYQRQLREIVQMSIFGDRYYKRIARLAALAILFWDKKLFDFLAKNLEGERSVYAASFLRELRGRFAAIKDRNERNIVIARSLRGFRYPLDGIRFDQEIGKLRERFPELKSVIRERFS